MFKGGTAKLQSNQTRGGCQGTPRSGGESAQRRRAQFALQGGHLPRKEGTWGFSVGAGRGIPSASEK